MKIISCVSYHGSGSSAVTDLLSECSSVYNMTNYEFRFIHDLDGVADLEYHLVDNFNRHNSGHALKRYKWLVDYYSNHFMVKRYEPFFNNLWKKISYEYIDELTDFKFHGSWQYDYYDRGALFSFFFKLPQRVMARTFWKNYPDKTIDLLFNEITYASHPSRTKFLELTKNYTSRLFSEANRLSLPFITVDQVLPSSNIARHMRYFDDIYAVIVDRDPRDVFILSKYFWKSPIVPKDVKTFCKWFRYTRSTQKKELVNDQRIKLIQFEDLIYQYENTKNDLLSWLGVSLSDHSNRLKHFNPDISKKNTALWKNSAFAKEARLIEQELAEFLYRGL